MAKTGPAGLRSIAVYTRQALNSMIEEKKAAKMKAEEEEEAPAPTPQPSAKEEKPSTALVDSPSAGEEEGTDDEGGTLKRKTVAWGKQAANAKKPKKLHPKRNPATRERGRGRGGRSHGAVHSPCPRSRSRSGGRSKKLAAPRSRSRPPRAEALNLLSLLRLARRSQMMDLSRQSLDSQV